MLGYRVLGTSSVFWVNDRSYRVSAFGEGNLVK